MTVFVVDTNVAVAANGRNTHADVLCQLACVEKLEDVAIQGTVAVDAAGDILDEYHRYLCLSGKPGVGDKFFKHIFNNMHNEDRVNMVAITPSDDPRKSFEELPINSFDRSDRKFLAVAVVARAVVLNATDSDWAEHGELMEALEVEIDQLCPQHALKGAGRQPGSDLRE